MPRSKPKSLDVLRREAKFLHRALLGSSEAEKRRAAERFLVLRSYQGGSVDDVLQSASDGKIQRKHAFIVLALEMGFPTWEEYLSEVHENRFLWRIVREVKESGAKNLYIAIMPVVDPYGEEPTTFHLEVELPWYEIRGSYDTGHFDLERARTIADALDSLLVEAGMRVYRSRDEWQHVEGMDVYAPSADILDLLESEDFWSIEEDRSTPDMRVLSGAREIGEESVAIEVEITPERITFIATHPRLSGFIPEGSFANVRVAPEGRLLLDAHPDLPHLLDVQMEQLWELLDEAIL